MKESLEPFKNKRIKVNGVFDKFTLVQRAHGKVVTALLQNIHLADTGELVADHCYVQDAETLQAADPHKGELVECQCMVMQYKRRLKTTNVDGVMAEMDFGLYRPTAIELPERYESTPIGVTELPFRTRVASQATAVPDTSADWLGALKQLKQLGDLFGYDELIEMIQTLR